MLPLDTATNEEHTKPNVITNGGLQRRIVERRSLGVALSTQGYIGSLFVAPVRSYRNDHVSEEKAYTFKTRVRKCSGLCQVQAIAAFHRPSFFRSSLFKFSPIKNIKAGNSIPLPSETLADNCFTAKDFHSVVDLQGQGSLIFWENISTWLNASPYCWSQRLFTINPRIPPWPAPNECLRNTRGEQSSS